MGLTVTCKESLPPGEAVTASPCVPPKLSEGPPVEPHAVCQVRMIRGSGPPIPQLVPPSAEGLLICPCACRSKGKRAGQIAAAGDSQPPTVRWGKNGEVSYVPSEHHGRQSSLNLMATTLSHRPDLLETLQH